MPTRTIELSSQQDPYAVLALPSPRTASGLRLTQHEIKQAYHRALLRNHPDKSPKNQQIKSQVTQDPAYTIDQVNLAYKTLNDPTSRAAYDREQALVATRQRVDIDSQVGNLGSHAHIGIDTVDLDEMIYNEATRKFHRACRCGKEKAYVVTEGQLETHEEEGEIVVGCQGCSLYLKITFTVAAEG